MSLYTLYLIAVTTSIGCEFAAVYVYGSLRVEPVIFISSAFRVVGEGCEEKRKITSSPEIFIHGSPTFRQRDINHVVCSPTVLVLYELLTQNVVFFYQL